MRTSALVLAVSAVMLFGAGRAETPTGHGVTAAGPTAEAALGLLVEGNERFVSDRAVHPHLDKARLMALAKGGQHPFATILTCSDSRIPVEAVFDQGAGDLFVIRVAGNVAATDEIGTIEYGAEHLGAQLVVVMGHTKCGAVGAAVSHAPLHGSTQLLVEHVTKAAEAARRENPGLSGDALVTAATRANVWAGMRALLTKSLELQGLVREGRLKIVGAVYDIETGAVTFLGEHPAQGKILAGSVAGEGGTTRPVEVGAVEH